MPVYEYQCLDCRKTFNRVEPLRQHRPGQRLTCPKCAGHRVERVYSQVYAVTSKKS